MIQATDNNGVKYLLSPQQLSDRCKRNETKGSKETVHASLTTITKKNRPTKIWVAKATEFAGKFEKLCEAEGRQICSTLTEAKAAFAERTMRSLKNLLYRSMEIYGYKYFHKLTQRVTTLNARKTCWIDLIPINCKKSDFLSIL